MPDDAPHVEVAGYVLGKLAPDETVVFEAHLAGCTACQGELADLEAVPELLDRAVPAVALPATLRTRTLAAIRETAAAEQAASKAEPAGLGVGAREPGAAAGVPSAGGGAAAGTDHGAVVAPRPRARRRWWALAAAAALVLAVALPAALLLRPPRPTTVAMVAAPGGQGHGEITVTPTDGGRLLEVAVEGLPEPRPGTLYSLWAIGPSDTPLDPDRVPIIQFATDADGKVRFQTFTSVPSDRFNRFDVTLEPMDNDPARNGPTVLLSDTI